MHYFSVIAATRFKILFFSDYSQTNAFIKRDDLIAPLHTSTQKQRINVLRHILGLTPIDLRHHGKIYAHRPGVKMLIKLFLGHYPWLSVPINTAHRGSSAREWEGREGYRSHLPTPNGSSLHPTLHISHNNASVLRGPWCCRGLEGYRFLQSLSWNRRVS